MSDKSLIKHICLLPITTVLVSGCTEAFKPTITDSSRGYSYLKQDYEECGQLASQASSGETDSGKYKRAYDSCMRLRGYSVAIDESKYVDSDSNSAWSTAAAIVGTAAVIGGGLYIASQMPKHTAPSYHQSDYSSSSSTNTSSETSTSLNSGSSYGSSSSYFDESKKLYAGKKRGMSASLCISISKLNGGFNVADHLVKNVCSRKINIAGICLPDSHEVKRDYPFAGVYWFSSGWSDSLEPSVTHPDPLTDICKEQNRSPTLVACYEGYQPYFTSSIGYSSVCLEE